MKLIPNAHKAHKMWSVRLAVAGFFITVLSGIATGWAAFQDIVQPITFLFVSAGLALVTGLLQLGTIIARLIYQPELHEVEDDPEG